MSKCHVIEEGSRSVIVSEDIPGLIIIILDEGNVEHCSTICLRKDTLRKMCGMVVYGSVVCGEWGWYVDNTPGHTCNLNYLKSAPIGYRARFCHGEVHLVEDAKTLINKTVIDYYNFTEKPP